MRKYVTGGVANPNKKVQVQKVAGAPKGVGPTKSVKIKDAQKKAGSNGVGHTKSKKITSASPASKKKQVK